MIFILDNIIGTYCSLLFWTTTNERTNERTAARFCRSIRSTAFRGAIRRRPDRKRKGKKRKRKKEEKIFKVQNRAKGVCR